MITIGFSTRKDNQEFIKYLNDSIKIKDIEIIQKINDNQMSLSKAYNEILKEAKHDIVVLVHDDIYFDTKGWVTKLVKQFEKNPDYGVIGVAGTTDLIDGCWWTLKKSSTGIVNHEKDGKKWESKFSGDQNVSLKEVVVLDGLFLAIDKRKIKHNFDESFTGFHFYDLGFCLPNHLDGVKLGVSTYIRVTHKSVGETNDAWDENKVQFEEKYKDKLPCKLTNNKTVEEKLNYDRDKIGIGIVTYNAEHRIKQTAITVPTWVKHFVIVNDGTPYPEGTYPPNAHVIQHETNKSVGAAKTTALKYLMEQGCEHLFLMEDDILIKNERVFDEYIRHSVLSGIKHLNFGLPDDGKNMKDGQPNPKIIVPYSEGIKIYLYGNLAGTFSYYQREVIDDIGYFDPRYINAMEHVDHTFMSIKKGYHTPMWFFADIENSLEYLQSLPNSESIINQTENLSNKQNKAVLYFKSKHKYFPHEITAPDQDTLMRVMYSLYNNR